MIFSTLKRSDYKETDEYLRDVCHFLKKYSNTWQDQCQLLAEEALEEIRKEENPKPETPIILDQLAYQRWHHGNQEEALRLLDEADTIRKRKNNYSDFTWGVMTRAMILWNKGAYRDALEVVNEGMIKAKLQGNTGRSGILNWVLGVVYFDMKEYDRSIENYTEAIDQCAEDEYMDYNTFAYACVGIGCALKGKGNFSEALQYFFKALNKAKENDLWMEESRALYELGILEYELGNYSNAEKYLEESLKSREERSNYFSSISNLIALGETQLKLERFDKAGEFFHRALKLAEKIDSKPKLVQTHAVLSTYFKLTGDYENALNHLEESAAVSRSINSLDLDSRFEDIRRFSI